MGLSPQGGRIGLVLKADELVRVVGTEAAIENQRRKEHVRVSYLAGVLLAIGILAKAGQARPKWRDILLPAFKPFAEDSIL